MATSGSGSSTPSSVAAGSYTLAQLILRYRSWLDDLTGTPAWSDDDLTEYVDLIQKEVVTDILRTQDRFTADIADVTIAQGDGLVSISPRITKILTAKLDSDTDFLELHDAAYMDQYHEAWATDTTEDTPTTLVTHDVGDSKVFLYPLSPVADVLRLTVRRTSLVDLDYTTHSTLPLEIDKYAHLITHGVLAQAYLKQDVDTSNPVKAAEHAKRWEADKEKIKVLALRGRHEPQYVMGGDY